MKDNYKKKRRKRNPEQSDKVRCPKHGNVLPRDKKLYYCEKCDCYYLATPIRNNHDGFVGTENGKIIKFSYIPGVHFSTIFQGNRIGRGDEYKKKSSSFILMCHSNNEVERTKSFHASSIYSKIEFRSIEKSNLKTSDVFLMFEDKKNIRQIQLIKNSYNHVTQRHRIDDRIINVIYYIPDEKKFSAFKILFHYCESCNMYFDFYDSFIAQIEKYKIRMCDIITSCLDDHYEKIKVDFAIMNEHSLLNILGYHVGRNGLSTSVRQKLLSRLITEKVLSASEIKNHLEFLIRFHTKRKNMDYALSCWQEDILFVNDYLLGVYKIRNS